MKNEASTLGDDWSTGHGNFHSTGGRKEISLSLQGMEVSLTTLRDVNDLIDALSPEQFAVDERLPYWAELWHSAIALAAHLIAADIDLAEKKVLDLGCGLGLCGITAARRGARVVFADYEDAALEFARHNLHRNCPPQTISRCSFLPLDFRSPPPDTWDIILAADILYESRMIHPALRFFEKALAPGGIIYLSEPNRGVAEGFFAQLSIHGLVARSRLEEAVYQDQKVAIGIHHIMKRAASSG